VCEGLAARDANAFSVQHHPEAGPGPHDSRYLFARFVDRMTAFRGGRIPQLFAETDRFWPPGQRVGGSDPPEPVGLPEPAAGVA
jgi:Glutamine amidotransferase class-I